MEVKALQEYLEKNKEVRQAEDGVGYVLWGNLVDLIVMNCGTMEVCFWESGLDYTIDMDHVEEVYISYRKLSIRTTYGYLNIFRDECEKVKAAMLQKDVD